MLQTACLLLNNTAFIEKMAQIKNIARQINLHKLNNENIHLCFKYAEFISNQHYGLMINAKDLNRATFALKTLKDCNEAIEMVEQFLTEKKATNDQKQLMTLLSIYAIPLFYLRIRLLSNAYGTLDIENKHVLLNEDLQKIRLIDRRCMDILNRPPHLFIAVIEGAQLKKVSYTAYERHKIENCLLDIEKYADCFETVNTVDNKPYDWSSDQNNLLNIEECRGNCFLKLGQLTEAYDAFNNMFTYAINGHPGKAGLARLNQAKILLKEKAKKDNTQPEWLQLKCIRQLLTEAQAHEAQSPFPTTARAEISTILEHINQLSIKQEEVFEMEDLPLPSTPPNSPSSLFFINYSPTGSQTFLHDSDTKGESEENQIEAKYAQSPSLW
ncbi:MAG: hypothetical protein RLZ35_1232 [Pseudomonadota bacterium]|jgi:hypothetical protein